MKPRQRRLLWVLAGLVLVATAVTLVLRALNSNVMFFQPQPGPGRLGSPWGSVPIGRAGGTRLAAAQRRRMLLKFIVTDEVQRVPVQYRGLLPDLFREGKGVVVSGKLQPGGAFRPPKCWPSMTRTTCRPRRPMR